MLAAPSAPHGGSGGGQAGRQLQGAFQHHPGYFEADRIFVRPAPGYLFDGVAVDAASRATEALFGLRIVWAPGGFAEIIPPKGASLTASASLLDTYELNTSDQVESLEAAQDSIRQQYHEQTEAMHYNCTY